MFVEFGDEAQSSVAVRELNGVEVVDNHPIHVTFTKS